MRFYTEYIKECPAPIGIENLESTKTQILSLKSDNPKADTTALEKEIDQHVYQLYNLTEDEIKIIEEATT